MKRRDFIHWISISSLAASLPVAIAACNRQPDSASGTAPDDKSAPNTASNPANFVAIGTLADLDHNGYLISEDKATGPIIVIQDPQNSNALIALSAQCTHNGCEVDWQEDLFACPCHGSKFNPDGSVVNGPAAEPLMPYAAKIEGSAVLVAFA